MTMEDDILREQIWALMKAPQLQLPDYSADPLVVRRVGKMLSETSARVCLQLLTNEVHQKITRPSILRVPNPI